MSHLIFIAVGGFFAALVALTGALALAGRRRTRRLRASLSLLACPKCQKVIGPDSARAAMKEDRRWKRTRIEAAAVEGLDIKLSPEWRFKCPACRAPLVFEPDANTLIVGPRAHP